VRRNISIAFGVSPVDPFTRPLATSEDNMSSTKNPGRFAGLLYLLASIVGFFAMGYVPSKLIVHGNAAATANNVAASCSRGSTGGTPRS
jgi:hypothetical protein